MCGSLFGSQSRRKGIVCIFRPRNGMSPPPNSIQMGHFDLLAIDKEFAIIRGKRINAIQGHDRFKEMWRPRKDQIDLTVLPVYLFLYSDV